MSPKLRCSCDRTRNPSSPPIAAGRACRYRRRRDRREVLFSGSGPQRGWEGDCEQHLAAAKELPYCLGRPCGGRRRKGCGCLLMFGLKNVVWARVEAITKGGGCKRESESDYQLQGSKISRAPGSIQRCVELSDGIRVTFKW